VVCENVGELKGNAANVEFCWLVKRILRKEV